EEYDLALRITLRERERIERRVHDAHLPTPRAHLLQVAIASGHAQHVAERGEDHAGSRGQLQRLVDLLERRHAHGAARTMDHLHRTIEQFVESLPHDRVRLSAANFHERPRTGGRLADALDQWKCDGRVAVLGEVLHFFAAAAARSAPSMSWRCSSYSGSAAASSAVFAAMKRRWYAARSDGGAAVRLASSRPRGCGGRSVRMFSASDRALSESPTTAQ